MTNKTSNTLSLTNGWLDNVCHAPSPHFSERDTGQAINLLVVHNISLPPGKFGGHYIRDFFLGKLDCSADPFFADIENLKVSAHCVISRTGEITQFVSFNDKAWHAGVSSYLGQEKCNDFSIGIELEGTDDIAYTEQQYQQLAKVAATLRSEYPDIIEHMVGHCDIAPGRKTDPGAAFDWSYFRHCVAENL